MLTRSQCHLSLKILFDSLDSFEDSFFEFDENGTKTKFLQEKKQFDFCTLTRMKTCRKMKRQCDC